MISGVGPVGPKKPIVMKKKTSCEAYMGDEILPGYLGIIINLIRRMPLKQPGFNGK